MKKLIVIALGGNALIRPGQRGTFEEQVENLVSVARAVAKLTGEYRVVLTHGNGPQVGNLYLQQEALKEVPPMPLHACVAMTQSLIGYMIQTAFSVCCPEVRVNVVPTRVLVDRGDSAFEKPTKPIGPYYPDSDVERLKSRGWRLVYLQGKGWRRVVPSPRPVDIVDLEQIRCSVEKFDVTVAAGGGGVPVISTGSGLAGIDAVIDKDLASSLLASLLGAEKLVILTDVEGAYREFGTPQQSLIRDMCVEEAERLLSAGYFPPGSMGPKVEAAALFVRRTGRSAAIGSLDRLEDVIRGTSGTVVRKCST